jgi:hypothetical protein
MPDDALNLAQVLWDERTALSGALPLPGTTVSLPGSTKQHDQLGKDDLDAIYQLLNKDDRWALCLSGGGIRSAALALGVVQYFAQQYVAAKNETDAAEPLLKQFDYLSTVSGGGYLGSWLSAWLYQARRDGGNADTVLTDLAQRASNHNEADPIVNLRRDSHFLAPKFSAISADVWADIATILRNLVLVWLLIMPPLMFAVLLSKALAYLFWETICWDVADHSSIVVAALGTAAIVVAAIGAVACLLLSLSFAAANRPTRAISNHTQAHFFTCDLAAFSVGAVLLLFVLASLLAGTSLSHQTSILLLGGGLLGLIIYGVSWFAAYLWARDRAEARRAEWSSDWWVPLVELLAWCVAGSVFGLLVAAGWALLLYWIPTDRPAAWVIVFAFGVPWVLAARIIADVAFVAPITLLPRSDGDLEYQARASGLYTLVLLAWLIWLGLVLFASWLENLGLMAATTWLGSVGGISGAIAATLGTSSKTPAFIRDATNGARYLTLNRLAAIAATIFGAVLIVAIAVGFDWLLFPRAMEQAILDRTPKWLGITIALVGLAIGAFIIQLVININRFSLHGLYRNRLVRAFLGASRLEAQRDETSNKFTDFDTQDSPCLDQLWEPGVAPRNGQWKPLHIINTTLNLVASKNLAWQERKAAPFTFSPLHAGSGSLDSAQGAFRRTYQLGTAKPYGGGGSMGPTLGTAMAISGAAVSPNMGYNSSPGVAFLMTLFNVRLGWWLPNPQANPSYWLNSPRWALGPLFMEMFGLTSERRRWIYLSDGAHFENFGLYEMVRRRCRVIVVVDGGQDPDYEFQDLGNALRKIWIDLGVRIEFAGLDRLKKRFKERPTPATSEPYWAVGRVLYRKADQCQSSDSQCGDGLVLYFKAGLHGTEPMDVLSYAIKHPTFPHETTANQFFSESQLEAYRVLGYEMVDNALCYAERERRCGTATGSWLAAITAQPLDKFRCSSSTMTLRDIIAKLEAQLLRAA